MRIEKAATKWAWLVRKIPLDQLSRLCDNLRVCLSAGMPVLAAMRTCQRTAPNPILRRILLDAAERVARGMEMADALEPWRDRFPTFFLPVLRCGERSGRIDATLEYLRQHCHQLAGPARVARNTWLVPLCIMLFASAINIGAYLIFARFSAAVHYILGTAWFYAGIAAVVIAAKRVPVLKTVVARLRLMLPLIGAADRELAVDRFFHAMNVLYSTGGLRVEGMIRLAAESIDNIVLKADYLGAAAVIESGGTITEAFSAIRGLSREYRATIAAGDEAGKLEEAFDTVCRSAAAAATSHLERFQEVYFRVVAQAVIFSIVATLLSLYGL